MCLLNGRSLAQGMHHRRMCAAARPHHRTDKALDLCKSEWHAAFDLAKEKGLASTKALRMAADAYKLAMPKMDSLPTIRAAIACIAQGIQLEVFDGRDGSQLLYAAQNPSGPQT